MKSIMLNVIIPYVVMPHVVMLNVVMLNVVAPIKLLWFKKDPEKLKLFKYERHYGH